MGRTLPTASIIFYRMKDQLKTFQRGLSPGDQRLLDELFIMAGKHIAEVQYTADPLAEQIFLMAILLEMHKHVMQITIILDEVGK